MSQNVAENNKRIAKNTVMLYIRMIVVMLVSLYTSRVVLDVLGEVDYGLNNVVGGVVTMLSFLGTTMTHASQRFFSIDLGTENYEELQKVFKVNFTIYCFIALIVIVLGESLGLWFIHNYMTVPFDRIKAVEWVLHYAVLSFSLTMLVTPFRAALMARENMAIVAWLSILEVLGKLAVAFLIVAVMMDKLIAFSLLNFVILAIVNGVYIAYARIKYPECRMGLCFDVKMMKSILSFTGWSLFGHSAMVVRSQGINILLNVYCGPVINAARAIAFQVNTAVSSFYTNFFMAVKPQIIKYFSVDDKNEMFRLVVRSSKFCYFLVLFFTVPLLLETELVLNLWLKEVPDYTSLFVKYVLVNTLIESIVPGLTTSIDANGKIRNYQLAVSFFLFLVIPISWIMLKNGCDPIIPMIVVIGSSVIRFLIQLYTVRVQLSFNLIDFLKQALVPIFIVTLVSFFLPIIIKTMMNVSTLRSLVIIGTSMISCVLCVYLFGITKSERNTVFSYVSSRFKKLSK